MESASEQIRALFAKSEAQERQRIQEQLRDLQRDLASDWEVFFSLALGPLQVALAEIGFDLGIFTTLASRSTPASLDDLAHETKAAPTLLSHLLQTMSSLGFITEASKGMFEANRLTRIMANPHVVGAAPHLFELHVPVGLALPSYLKKHNYQDITGAKELPFHQAKNTNLAPFEWMKQEGSQMKALGHVMLLDATDSCFATYPIQHQIGSFSPTPDSALLVDIGGGFGQHAVAFQRNNPHLPGRIVVQDIPSTLAHAPTIDGIEFQAHDFFTPQPIRDAKFYYLRHIMHDWSDDDCVKILSSIVPAMGPESRVLIDEIVLPETKWPWQVAICDIAMMAALGGIERSREEWEVLLDKAGLRIVDVYVYDARRCHGIVSAVPK